MFGKVLDEEPKADPEREEGVEKGGTTNINTENPDGSTVAPFTDHLAPAPADHLLEKTDNQSLQTIVKSTLEDFYTAIERLKTVTVEIDKVSIGAENWLKSNN